MAKQKIGRKRVSGSETAFSRDSGRPAIAPQATCAADRRRFPKSIPDKWLNADGRPVLATRPREFAGGTFGMPCALVIKRLTEGERHDKAVLNDALRTHGVAL